METDGNIGNEGVSLEKNVVTSGNSFKLLFGLIDIEQKRKMSMTRQERERAVLDLYHNKGKKIREIAQEARMSFRDIGSILNKADEARRKEQEQQQGIDDDNVSDKNHHQQEQQQLSLAT